VTVIVFLGVALSIALCLTLLILALR
jgi:hypothetical protein